MLKALKVVSGGLLLAFLGCGVEGDVDEPLTETRSALEADGNDYGVAETFHTTGQSTSPTRCPAAGHQPAPCATCHAPDQGWTMTADANKELFKESDGLAPLFNLVDEGNRPDADISTKDAAQGRPSIRDGQAGGHAVHAQHQRGRRAGRQYTITAVRGSVRLPRDHQLRSSTSAGRPSMANETKVSSILNTSRSDPGHPGDARGPVQRRRRAPRAA